MGKLFTVFLSMLLVGLLISCAKEVQTLNPDLTTGLTGTYPITYYRIGPQSVYLPFGGASGQFDATRVDMSHLHVVATLTYSPGDVRPQDLGTIELRRDPADSKKFIIYSGSKKYGWATTTDITLSDTAADGMITEIKARR